MTICTVTGSLEQVGLTPARCKLVVTLPYPYTDETETPDKYLLASKKEYIITAGSLSIQLRETESDNIAVRFQFFNEILPSTTPATFEVDAAADFYTIIPDTLTAEIGSLTPSGITNDTLATGAIRVAKEIFKNPTLVAQIAQATKIYNQDTLPAAPVADRAFWIKPSDRVTYSYNLSGNKWYSSLESFSASGNNVAIQSSFNVSIPTILGTNTSFLVPRISVFYNVAAPNDATNYWRFTARQKLWANASESAIAGVPVINSSAVAPNALTIANFAINSEFLPSTVQFFQVFAEKVGSPGNLNISVSVDRSLAVAGAI